jgi:UDP-3-O-acyl N-acetylglucosamine deacetylase
MPAGEAWLFRRTEFIPFVGHTERNEFRSTAAALWSRKTDVKKLSYRYQRTLAGPADVQGTGYLTGAVIRLRFLPAPPHTGVVFQRTDLRDAAPIPARAAHVTGTSRRTTLGRAPNQVELVEHVLAALAGLRIDNCVVQLNGPEPPGLDGSARGFLDQLRRAGAVLQPARRAAWTVETPLRVTQQGATLTLHPAEHGLKISYLLDYGPGSPIDRQMHTEVVTPEGFANAIAHCRTFLLEEEAAALRRQGLGSHTTEADLLVFGPHGPIGNQLRHANEPARHKILDLVGDLSLFGHDLCGHLVAYRSGHPLNVRLARALCRELVECCGAAKMAA